MLRNRKNKRYNEEAHDEEDGRGRKYNIKSKIRSERFERLKDLQELPGHEVTLKLIQRHGFDKPILVTTPEGLGLAVPPKGFVVRDVGKLVGYDRMIDVMDVRTQKNIEMTMRDWCKYYESRNRDRLLNVISLEFSHTELATQIESPKIVKLLDWVDLVWPKFLKESQTESTNSIDKMKYPKVQKYCLMSVKGSYTDFHIDFGGTSVWYHIMRGKKIFWMAPPTELNLQAFEEWTLSGMQQDVFFGDTVEECFRVELSSGNTFFIPSGWIHAVYTLEDSLVFGGNFLHSFGIENQLKVSRIEDATKVPVKFRYPFYTEILWYVVQHYVHCLTGKSHLQNSPKNSATTTPEKNSKPVIETKSNINNNNNNINSNKKRQKIVNDDSLTESEHDDSDKTKRKKKNTPLPPKKRRGRPPKRSQKPQTTDDESTEIDSDHEDVKPTKSTTTCRMTKNSLLRLQYEVDEPNVRLDRNQISPSRSSSKQTKSLKNEVSPSKETNTTSAKNKSSKIDHPIKPDPSVKAGTVSDSATEVDANNSDVTALVATAGDATRLNGWSNSNKSTIWSNPDSEPKAPLRVHITKTELNGLKLLVKYLSKLSGAKKNMPNLIRNSRALLDDCKKLIAEHENDDPELAVTGIPVTPDLLITKKSDINQLIEQFFKPTEASSTDELSNDTATMLAKSRSDSSTLTMQQRLKYNQTSNHCKIEEKRNSISASDSPVPKQPNHKDSKSTSNAKKPSSTSSLASASANNNSSNATNSSTDQPRPKSPPTRPLSNKQYSSRTKNDKNDTSLVLPGSFADLIAATSTAKEAFNVSSADVTSTLFGLKSPTKGLQNATDKQPVGSANLPKKQNPSPFDIESLTSTTSIYPAEPKNQNEMKREEAAKANSPEPPKITPTKRFITPALNRPQVKEKLIFASAPYVSPVSASNNQRYPHPWQISPTTIANQHRTNNQQQLQSQHTQQSITVPAKFNESPKPSPIVSPSSTPIIGARQPSVDAQMRPLQQATINDHEKAIRHNDQPTNQSNGASSASLQKSSTEHIAGSSDKAGTSGPDYRNSESTAVMNVVHNEKPLDTKPDIQAIDKSLAPPAAGSLSQAPNTSDDQKVKRPRGPIKKSKEARQAIEMSPPNPTRPPIPVSVIKLDTESQQRAQVVAQGAVSITNPPTQQTTDANKIKTKAKRPKKQKDGNVPDGQSRPIATVAAPMLVAQSRPPLIHGLVAPAANSSMANSVPQQPKAGQQYLISRPVLFNTMPTFSSAHMPHMPPTSMPVFTTPIATSMGLPNMQPGARILWATRPSAAANAASESVAPPRLQTMPTQTKKQAAKPTTSNDLQARPADNAALLSLATTALSTAPLPTNPTLSSIGSRIPNPAQAYVVNPNLFAAHQYYNPYMQQIPMVQFPSRDPNPQAALMAGSHLRPIAPRPTTGQLLFAPLMNQTGQPRYLITQPGFMPPRHHAPTLYSSHQPATSLSFAAFQPTVGTSSSVKETAKVKKVKTR